MGSRYRLDWRTGQATPAGVRQGRGQPASPPAAQQVKTLENALSKGETQVKSSGGNRVSVTLRKLPGTAQGVVNTGVKAGRFASGVSIPLALVDENALVLTPNALMQKAVEHHVAEGVERGVRWLNAKFPPPNGVAPENELLRRKYLTAKNELAVQGDTWRAQLKPGSQYGIQAREDAYKHITTNLGAIDQYNRHLFVRAQELAGKSDGLHPIANHIEPYISALNRLANELEDKVELAAVMPGGYYFALELFSLSQFVRGVSKQVDQLTGLIAEKNLDYREAIDASHKAMDQLDRIDDEWSEVLMEADQAAGL